MKLRSLRSCARPLGCAPLAAALVTALAAPAHAQVGGAEAAGRAQLLQDAQAARDAGNHTAALAAAERAGRIEMTPSVRYFIANEQRALGRYADALGTAQRCLRDNEANPNPRTQGPIRAACEGIVTEARAHVARLVLEVPSPAPDGLVVRVNGAVVSDAFFGTAYLVDAGRVTIVARDAAGRSFERVVEAEASAPSIVAVRLEGAAPAAIPGDRAGPSVPPPAAGPSLAGPVALLAVGGVALGLAPVFHLAMTSAAVSALRASGTCSTSINDIAMAFNEVPGPQHRNDLACADTPENQQRRDAIGTGSTLTAVSAVAGSALVAGGAVWLALNLLRAPASAERAPAAALVPTHNGAVFVAHF